jgi:hypothetical protein
MLRIARVILALTILALLIAVPATASAQIEDWQRVVRSRHASAVFTQVSGCDQVEIFVSATDGKYVNRLGPVNKQGLLGVLLLVRDVCGEPGPKGYPVVFSADGMTLDRLRTTPQFDRASVAATLPAIDSNGDALQIDVDLQWRPLADYERSKVSGHGWFPAGEKRGAWVGTFSHNMMAPAEAWGTIWLDGEAMPLEPTQDAVMEQVRYLCKVIQHPRGGAEVDC